MRIELRLAVAGVATVALLSGCGSSDKDPGAAASKASAPAPATLKVVTSSVSPLSMELYVAQQRGLFKKHNLTVDISAVGTNYSSLIVSGRADITNAGVQTPVALQTSGKDAIVLRGLAGGGTGGTLVGSPKTAKTLAQLASLDKCRIGSSAKGTNGWGYLQILQKKIGSKCDVVPFTEFASALAAFRSGQLDAMVSAPAFLQDLVDEGKAVMLVDTRDTAQFAAQYVPTPFLETAYWGMRPNLESKKDALDRFLAALDESRAWVDAHTDDQVAETLVAYDDAFRSMKRPTLVGGVNASRAFMAVGNDKGHISEQQWKASIDGLHSISVVPVGSDDPAVAYDKLVVAPT